MVWHCLIQFRQCWQPILREQPGVSRQSQSPKLRQERLGSLLEQRHRLRDVRRRLNHHVIARAMTEQYKVVVIVDQTWDDHTPVEIDYFRARIQFAIFRRADIGETPFLNVTSLTTRSCESRV